MVIQKSIRASMRSAMGVVAEVLPTTVQFTASQFALGFSGSTSTTKNAARIYARGLRTLWAGVITGSSAILTATSEFGSLDELIQCSVDGGEFVSCAHTGGAYTLFTGLSSTPKFVQVRFNWDWNDVGYIASSGNVLAVTGQPPAMATISNWISSGSISNLGFYNSATVANIAGFTPVLQATSDTTYGSNVGTIKLRGAFTNLYVAATGNPHRIGVSKNGEAPTFHTATSLAYQAVRGIKVPCTGELATYYVWDSGTTFSNGGTFAVAGDASLQDVGLMRRLDQYGDSITYGSGPGATRSDTETMRVAAQLGFIGSTNGVSGHTIAQLKALLDTVLPLRTVTSNDVAILAIGRNNVGAMDATAQTDYGLCISKLLAKGYGKVLCRAILPTPTGNNLYPTDNAALQSVVTAKANPNVIWVPTETWLGYESTDATHPTTNGYATLAGYATPAYTTALGL